MGIGLSAQGVNMNRLPGWDKNSFGYQLYGDLHSLIKPEALFLACIAHLIYMGNE
jgi:hypothetical protein